MIVTLVLCLFDFKDLMDRFNKQRDLILSILLFISTLFITGIINHTTLDEYDNYMRILLLTPLLVISLEKKEWELILILCLCSAILHMFLYTNIINRPMSYIQSMQASFSGTASWYLTYGYMLATVIGATLFTLVQKNKINIFLYVPLIILALILLIFVVGGKGPLLLLICLLVYSIKFLSKNKKILLISIIIFFITLTITTNNKIPERFNGLFQLSGGIINNIEDKSTRERAVFILFGVESILENYIYGIGPSNTEKHMHKFITENSYISRTSDHLHNDYFDIATKFGFPALVLLIFYYSRIIKYGGHFTFIFLFCLCFSQLFQSQFAHHQATTFFISLLYLSMKKITNNKP